ncbi:hypothetical protein PAXRUDRAFT_321991 [Paxillus rubicundulus Ve08.2h10]|uniref:Uncharacterized protein n=1 Tax=Paxillus rubicundulus Ve08.2h10 TaxID=930991 RepID=A0A0D0DF27_9AGAM|nr:hypothetical protein PAXRUDRAFT_321991 [Paxillus rubicundulus Ve08.2h10]
MHARKFRPTQNIVVSTSVPSNKNTKGTSTTNTQSVADTQRKGRGHGWSTCSTYAQQRRGRAATAQQNPEIHLQ